MAERGQVLGHHRTGDARTRDEHLAAAIVIENAAGWPTALAPRCVAATQIVLVGILLIEHGA